MSIVIRLDSSKQPSTIRRVKAEDLCEFLGEIEKSFLEDGTCSACTVLWKSGRFDGFKVSIEAIAKFFDLLANIKIVYGSGDDTSVLLQTQDVPPPTREDIQEKAPIFAKLMDAFSAERNLAAKCQPDYSFFSPAYGYADVLDQFYGELNPGKVIGGYLNSLFLPTRSLLDEAEEKVEVHYQSDDAHFIAELGNELIRNLEGTGLDRGAYALTLKAMFYDDEFSQDERVLNQRHIHHLFKNLTSYPQSVVDFWLDEFHTDGILADESFFGANAEGSMESEDFGWNDFLLKLLAPSLLKHFGRFHLHGLPGKVSDDCRTIKLSALVQFSYALRDHSIELPSEDFCTVKHLFNEYRMLRSFCYNGVVPNCEPGDLSVLQGELGWCVDDDDFDITILISESEFNFTDYAYSDSYEIHHGKVIGEVIRRQRRTECYVRLIKATLEAGHREFAVALLSFYLFSQSFVCKGAIGELRLVIPLIEDGLLGAGRKMLRRTLELVIEITEMFPEESGNAVLSRTLQSYLPKPADLQSLTAKRAQIERDQKVILEKHRSSKREVIEDLEHELGKEEFTVLHKRSLNYLIDTEMKYRKLFQMQGFGMEEWSGLVVQYCLVIENELQTRLEKYNVEYQDMNVSVGRKPGKITFGGALWALKNKMKYLPFATVIQNSSLYRLSENRKLIRKLERLCQKYRNKASHSEEVTDEIFIEFRREYFAQGVLKEFLNNLVTTGEDKTSSAN